MSQQKSKFVKPGKSGPRPRNKKEPLGQVESRESEPPVQSKAELAQKQEEAHNSILRKLRKDAEKKVVRIYQDVQTREQLSASKNLSTRKQLVMVNVDVEKKRKHEQDKQRGKHASCQSIGMTDSVAATTGRRGSEIATELRVQDLEHVYKPPASSTDNDKASSTIVADNYAADVSDLQAETTIEASPPKADRPQLAQRSVLGKKKDSQASMSSVKLACSSEEDRRAVATQLPQIRHVRKAKKARQRTVVRKESIEFAEEHPYLENQRNLMSNHKSRQTLQQTSSRRSLIEAQSSDQVPAEERKNSRNAYSEGKARPKGKRAEKLKTSKSPRRNTHRQSFEKMYQGILPYLSLPKGRPGNFPALSVVPASLQLLKNAQYRYGVLPVTSPPASVHHLSTQDYQRPPASAQIPD